MVSREKNDDPKLDATKLHLEVLADIAYEFADVDFCPRSLKKRVLTNNPSTRPVKQSRTATPVATSNISLPNGVIPQHTPVADKENFDARNIPGYMYDPCETATTPAQGSPTPLVEHKTPLDYGTILPQNMEEKFDETNQCEGCLSGDDSAMWKLYHKLQLRELRECLSNEASKKALYDRALSLLKKARKISLRAIKVSMYVQN